MLKEHETMCCAHCGPGPDGRETLVRIDCDGEGMMILLDAGWCFKLMIVGGPHLSLEVYCPSCSIKMMSTPTLNNLLFTEPETPTTPIPSNTIHCPHCGKIANLHYDGKRCIGCDECYELEKAIGPCDCYKTD